jgi:Ni/Co efflux regulator RcnB
MKKNPVTLAIMAIALLSSSLAFAQLEAQTQAEDAARNKADSIAVQPRRGQAQPVPAPAPAPQINQTRPQRPSALPPSYSNDYRRDDRRYDSSNYYRYDERRPGSSYQLRRGGYLPPQYRHRQYIVEDWRGHRLNRPPVGYHWVQVGGDYVLVAITTGIILQLLLNN